VIVVEEMSAAREKELLKQWFETVQFDEESEGIPPLDDEEDDEERSISIPQAEERGLSKVDFEELMAELRKRDPDNPF
jgi:hypothetical protein